MHKEKHFPFFFSFTISIRFPNMIFFPFNQNLNPSVLKINTVMWSPYNVTIQPNSELHENMYTKKFSEKKNTRKRDWVDSFSFTSFVKHLPHASHSRLLNQCGDSNGGKKCSPRRSQRNQLGEFRKMVECKSYHH